MFEVKMRLRILTLSFAAIILSCTGSAFAQQLSAPAPDPIEQLRLTPEQRQRIRFIIGQSKDERQMINRRLREANIALDQALDAETVDENLLDQRINELVAAQAAQMRMKIQTEVKIRRELSPEQRAILRRLKLQPRDFVETQRPLNQRPYNQVPPRRP
jgi:Spy/CpxP family protein refolding chaperone